MVNPFAMDKIKMYDQAANNDLTSSFVDFGNASSRMHYDDGGATTTADKAAAAGMTTEQFKKLMDDYFKGRQGYDGYDGYRQPSTYGGRGYFPANMSPSIKFKNVNTYINGMPGGANQTGMPGVTANGKPNFGNMGNTGWDITSSPRLLGRKYHYRFGPGVGGPNDPGRQQQGSWLGNKLRGAGKNFTANLDANRDQYGIMFPSKERKLRMDEEQQDRFRDSADRVADQEARAAAGQEDINWDFDYDNQQAPLSIDRPTPDLNYQEGGEYDMTDEEIQRLIDGGYNIEYI